MSEFPERRDRRSRARRSTCRSSKVADFPFSIGDEFKRKAPYFFNTNLGVQHEIGGDWAVSADYARVYGYDLLVTWDINAPPFFALGPGQTRTLAQANALRPLGVPNRTGGDYNIPFTGFRSLYFQFNGGHTEYHALKLGVTKRFSNRYAAQLNYTYGHARGDVDNFRLNTAFVPGLTALDGDRGYQWGPSDTDVPHVFVASGTYEAPFGIRVGGILFARSGFPYTGVVGVDSDGDGFTGNAPGNARLEQLWRSAREPEPEFVQAAVEHHARHQRRLRLEALRRAAAGDQAGRVQPDEPEEHPGPEQHHRPQPRGAAGELRHHHRRCAISGRRRSRCATGSDA